MNRRAGEGSWEKQAGKLMEEYEAKCTRENYLLVRVLEAILARIPNLEVNFSGKMRGRNSRGQKRSARY